VLLSEQAFVTRTYEVGESVRLSWSEADARPLGPGAARPSKRNDGTPMPRHEPLAALAAMAA
jgi:putative spermidine/putrescine transport system ATP-binding protein